MFLTYFWKNYSFYNNISIISFSCSQSSLYGAHLTGIVLGSDICKQLTSLLVSHMSCLRARWNFPAPVKIEQTRKSVHRTRMPPPNAIQKKGLYVTVTGIP